MTMLAVVLLPGVAWAAPANDSFANAANASSLPFGPSVVDARSATLESGEKKPTCYRDVGNSVWYRFTTTTSITVTADTIGSTYDTVLMAWHGSTLAGLNAVDCNDDGDGLTRVSRLSFVAAPGTQYYIQVAAAGGVAGDLEFRLYQPGSLGGSVTNSSGDPVSGICVSVWDGTASLASLTTDADGEFLVTELSPGAYLLSFEDCDGPVDYAEQWYEGATSRDGATAVNVAGGATATVAVVLLAAGETPERTLTLSIDGPGSVTDGTHTCTEAESPCTQTYEDGASVTLAAVPDEGAELMGWSDHCSGDGACVLDMQGDRSVTATFGLVGRHLEVVVPGGGSVTGTGIACPPDCDETFDHGSSVALTATPDPGWRFDAWSGACQGAGACVVPMTDNRRVSATFSRLAAAKASRSVALAGTPKKVPKGKKATLVATVSPCSGAARNDVVELRRGGSVVKTVAVDASCRAVAKVKITKRSTFTAVALEDTDSAASASNAVTIRVRKA